MNFYEFIDSQGSAAALGESDKDTPGALSVAPTGSPAGRAKPARLESSGNKVTSLGRVVAGCSCGVRTCETCGPRLGWRVRQNMLGTLDKWRRPGLLTLTIARASFKGPREAYERVTRGKFVPRLMRALGVKLWAWALEFQQQTGDGWPHWHLLVDLADVPGGKLNLAKAWELWRGKWGLGGLDLSMKAAKIASPEHAVFYLTKYLTKMPKGGFPPWVMKSHGIRFVQGCRKLGPLVAPPKPPQKKPAAAEPVKQYRPRQSMLGRIAACRMTSRVFDQQIDANTGELRFKYCGALPVSPAWLLQLLELGRLPAGTASLGESASGKPAVLLGPTASLGKLRDLLDTMGDVGRAQDDLWKQERRRIMRSNRYARRRRQAREASAAGRPRVREPAAGAPPSPAPRLGSERDITVIA